MKSLKEKWSSIVQSTSEKGESRVGGSSTVTLFRMCEEVVVAEVLQNLLHLA